MVEATVRKLLDGLSMPAMLVIAVLALGVTLGLIVSGQSLHVGMPGNEWFFRTQRLGVDVKSLGVEESKALAGSMAKLLPEEPLGIELVRLRDEQIGPFRAENKEVTVRFHDESDWSIQIAVACDESVFFAKKIAIFKLIASNIADLPYQGNQQRDLFVIRAAPLSECAGNNPNVVWVSSSLRQQLLGGAASTLSEVQGLARVLGLALQR